MWDLDLKKKSNMSIKQELFGGNEYKGEEQKERMMGVNMVEVLYMHKRSRIIKHIKIVKKCKREERIKKA
jgi:hypothetical protein